MENKNGAEGVRLEESGEETAVKESSPKLSVWLIILSILIPYVGLIYWLIKHRTDAERASTYCMIAIISLIVGQLLSIVLTVSRVTAIVGWVLSFFGA